MAAATIQDKENPRMPVLLFGIHVPTVGALFWKADFLSRLDQLP